MERSQLEELLMDCRCAVLDADIDEAERDLRAQRVRFVTDEIARMDQAKVVNTIGRR